MYRKMNIIAVFAASNYIVKYSAYIRRNLRFGKFIDYSGPKP